MKRSRHDIKHDVASRAVYTQKHYNATFHNFLLGKRGYVFSSIGLFLCLNVCKQPYSKSYERIAMEFYGGFRVGKTKKELNFVGDLGLLR